MEDEPFDPCAGGHPGSSWNDDGTVRCRRCGRELDLTPCGCGAPGHEELATAFCPNRPHS